jgi:PAS domain S-box-containing protein
MNGYGSEEWGWAVSGEGMPGRDREGDVAFDFERDLVCTVDSVGYFTSLNAGWGRLLGWTKEELTSRPFADFIHASDRQRTWEQVARAMGPDRPAVEFESRFKARGGGWRWLRWNVGSDGEAWFAVVFDVTEEKETERRLRQLLTGDRLLAYAQPILDQGRRVVAQEELLVRMRDEDVAARVMQPAEFVPDAERMGLIGLVDRWMVSQALAMAIRGRRMEVNLSAHSIHDAAFVAELEESVRNAGPSATNLVFEITQRTALNDPEVALEFTQRLAPLGCQFALDDFGVDLGSLASLGSMPVSFLKIDSSLVRQVVQTPEDQAMIRGIVAIARELRVQTVAEGIEDHATLELLHGFGVDYAQGYLIGRPAPLAHAGPRPAYIPASLPPAAPARRLGRGMEPAAPVSARRGRGTALAVACLVGSALALGAVQLAPDSRSGSLSHSPTAGVVAPMPPSLSGPLNRAEIRNPAASAFGGSPQRRPGSR